MTYTEDFKKNEGLAKKVLVILINDYLGGYGIRSISPEMNDDYLNLIMWSVKDYESCGFKVHEYEGYCNILKKQNDIRKNRLESMN